MQRRLVFRKLTRRSNVGQPLGFRVKSLLLFDIFKVFHCSTFMTRRSTEHLEHLALQPRRWPWRLGHHLFKNPR